MSIAGYEILGPHGRTTFAQAYRAADAVRHANEYAIYRLDLGIHDVLVNEEGNVLLIGFDEVQARFLYPPLPPTEPLAMLMGNPGLMAPEQIRGETPFCCPR